MPVQYELRVKGTGRYSEAELRKAIAEAQPSIGAAVVELMRDNFLKLNESRHRGITPVGFYEDAAGATGFTYTDDTTLIDVHKQGVLQRYRGGTITAKNVKNLAIPNSFGTREAYVEAVLNRPGLIEGLKYVQFGRGPDATKALGKGTGKEFQVMYWLKASVTQKPDSSVVPRADIILAVAQNALRRSMLATLTQK